NANSSSPANGFASRSAGAAPGARSAFGQPQPAAAEPTSPAASDSPSAGGKPVLQGVRITADAVNNSLLIYADQSSYRIIEATLQQVDQPQLQVAIDATIAEVTLNNTLSYGVQSFITSKNLGLKPDTGSILNTQSLPGPTGPSAAGVVTNALINRAIP